LVNQGRLAPGTVVMGPMLLLSHSDHILKNGSKDAEPGFGKPGIPIPPLLPLGSATAFSSFVSKNKVLPSLYPIEVNSTRSRA
jgi:hypothetical protein